MLIAEVAKIYDLSVNTLRYYERIGLLPQITRTPSGIRNYSESECKWVEFIKCMRNSGLSIEVLTKYVLLFQAGNQTIPARKILLIEQRKKLVEKVSELQATINRLDIKITSYDTAVSKPETQLINPREE